LARRWPSERSASMVASISRSVATASWCALAFNVRRYLLAMNMLTMKTARAMGQVDSKESLVHR
jgi:hypothetical protein